MIKIPQNPYVVSGTIYAGRGTVENSLVRINNDILTLTNNKGQYVLDLANLESGYTDGASYTIESWDSLNNEYKSETITVTGESQTKDLFLDDRNDKNDLNRGGDKYEILTVGAVPVSKFNLFPVENSERQLTRKVSGSAYPKYIGEAAPGTPTSSARWRVKYVLSNGEVTWANGNSEFDKVFDSRTSYSYS